MSSDDTLRQTAEKQGHPRSDDASLAQAERQQALDKEETFEPSGEERLRSRTSDVGEAIERHFSTEDAASLASIDRPPSRLEVKEPEAIVFGPYDVEVLALLAPASIFGVLARLGLLALVKYEGESIFTLAYPQALGCLFMGMALMLKEPLGNLYVPSCPISRR